MEYRLNNRILTQLMDYSGKISINEGFHLVRNRIRIRFRIRIRVTIGFGFGLGSYFLFKILRFS